MTLITYVCFHKLILNLSTYLHPIAIFVVLFCIFIFYLFIGLFFQKKKITLSLRLIHYSMIIYSIALLILLFFRPNGQDYDSINLKPFATILYYLSGQVDFLIAFYNIAANIGLFVPYGLYIDLKIRSSKYRYFYQITIPIMVISAIEFLQYITQRGSLDVDDLILNVIGVYVGYGIAPILKRIIKVDKK